MDHFVNFAETLLKQLLRLGTGLAMRVLELGPGFRLSFLFSWIFYGPTGCEILGKVIFLLLLLLGLVLVRSDNFFNESREFFGPGANLNRKL